MNRKIVTTRYALVCMMLAAAPRLFAQAAPANKPADTADEEAIQLSPFEVTTTNEGFQAVDTLGGARVKTKLSDTPSALTVATKQLLDTSGITNAQQLLVYTTNTEVAGLNGNFSGVSSRGSGVSGNAEAARLMNPSASNRSRGLSPMDNTRNYFQSEVPWDSFNIERVDISRGPNSFLFGVGSPSGISNYSTNEALFKDKGSLEFRYGSYGSTREALDYNKVLIKKELAARIDLLNDDTEYRQKPAYNHAKRAYGSLRYEPKFLNGGSSHTTIKANAEVGQVRSNNPRELPPMDYITGYFDGQVNKSGYNPFAYSGKQLTGIGAFTGLSPWVNAQDIHYIWPGPGAAYWYDAASGSLVNSQTTLNGVVGVDGKSLALRQTMAMYTSGFSNYAKAVNYADSTKYAGAAAGTVVYNDKSLTDPSIFNFYDNLIDGANKREWQNWKTCNVTLEQSFLNNKLSFQAVVDHQEFDQGQEGALLGYSEPYISVDLNAYKIQNDPAWGTAVANPNVGRAFVAGDFGGGDNSVKYIHDNVQLEANLNLKAEDFIGDSTVAKLVGEHSLTALVGEYKTKTETRTWSMYATDTTFDAAMATETGVASTGNITGNRTIQWVAYLGPSMSSLNSAKGLNLSALNNKIAPTSGTILNFNNTWTGTVSPTASYTNPLDPTGSYLQSQNPNNYKGWTNMPVTVLNSTDNIDQLYQSGNKSLQVLKSAAVMYQGHILNDMVVPEFGWRRDQVRQSSSNAPLDSNTHVASMNYENTGSAAIVNTTSTSMGVVLHLPKSLRGKLLFDSDISLSYFHGANATPKVRYGFDATQLPNESGKTDDISVLIESLGGRASLRVAYFKTTDKNAQATSGAADPLGNNGYYLYLLPAWGLGDAAASGLYYSSNKTNDGGSFANDGTGGALDTARKAAVAAWQNNVAQYFPQQFFDSYGLGANVAAATAGNWANVFNNPSAYPYPWAISNTGGGKINGTFPIISQDIESKGWEIEGTVRPVSNWDLTFNVSKVNAVQTALGQSTTAFINKEYAFFKGAAGQLPLWGYWGSASGSTLYDYFMQNIWSAYLLQTAQTGAAQPELRNWSAKGITNYNFNKGALKGWNIGGGFRWSSKPILGYGISQYTDPTGAKSWIMDVNKPLYGKIDEHADLWIGYSRKLSSKLDWRIQLNVTNVGEHARLTPVSVEPDGTPAQQRIMMGQTYSLSSTFKF